MRREYPRLEAAGLGIVAIGLGTPAEAHAFRERLRLPFPVLADPRTRAYRRYGLLHIAPRGTRWRSVTSLVRAIARYGGSWSRHQDMTQLGGVFIVDPAGSIRYAHRAERTADHPSPDELLRALVP